MFTDGEAAHRKDESFTVHHLRVIRSLVSFDGAFREAENRRRAVRAFGEKGRNNDQKGRMLGGNFFSYSVVGEVAVHVAVKAAIPY